MSNEFAPPGGKPRATKKQIKQMQENYKRAGELLQDTKEEEAEEKASLDQLFEEEFENVFDEPKKLGIYIGRFQPFHRGHENILKRMVVENDNVLICIGTGGTEEKNPFSYDICASFFSPYTSSNLFIKELPDMPKNSDWARSLEQIIQSYVTANTQLIFYGGDLENDYALQVITEQNSIFSDFQVRYSEISRELFFIDIDGEPKNISATLCRKALHTQGWNFLKQALPENVFHILHK